MGFLDRLFGRKLKIPADVDPDAPPLAPLQLASPLEAVHGVVAALHAMERGNRAPAERIYRGTRDGGLRYALARRLADDAPAVAGKATPFDAAVAGDPMWRSVRGMYHIRIGWDARGSGMADSVSEDGWDTLAARCERGVEDLREAAVQDPADEIPHVMMMAAARGLGDQALGAHAYTEAIGRARDSWAAAYQRIGWLSPRWFGSVEEVLAFARGEADRVGTGELAGLPILAHTDVTIYLVHFQKDAEAARAARTAAAPEIRDSCRRSVDAPGAAFTYATPIIRHHAGALLWQLGDEAGARDQLAKVGNVFESWCWGGDPKQTYANVRARLGL